MKNIRLVILAVIALTISGCATEGGGWTSKDTAAAMGALTSGYDTYNRIRYPQPVQPVPVAPVYVP